MSDPVVAWASDQGVDPSARARDLLAGLVVAVGERRGMSVVAWPLVASTSTAMVPPQAVADRWSEVHPDVEDGLGRLREALLSAERRQRGGAHYTPSRVAAGLWELAGDSWAGFGAASAGPSGGGVDGAIGRWTIVDPMCGGGALLLAAARGLSAMGVDPNVVAGRLVGADIDPLAADTADASLRLWAACKGADSDRVPRVRCADVGESAKLGLDSPRLVLLNPPFGGQFTRRTRRGRSGTVGVAADAGSSDGLLDTAGVAIWAAVTGLQQGDRIATLAPLSLASTRHASRFRAELHRVGELRHLWVIGRAFDADIETMGFVHDVHAEPASVSAAGGPERSRSPCVELSRGVPPERVVSAPPGDVRSEVTTALVGVGGRTGNGGVTWAPLVARALGVPAVELGRGRRSDGEPVVVGDLAATTAGFRQHFYGLLEHLADAGQDGIPAAVDGCSREFVPLLTARLVDPLEVVWGRRPCRVGGRTWGAPLVDLTALEREADIGAWARARLVPKLVLAPQTLVIEVAPDPDGRFLPGVPLVSIEPRDPEDLWKLAAAVAAPAMTAHAMKAASGSAMSAGSFKLSARQVADLPLPIDLDAWAEGTRRAEAVWAKGGAGADRDEWLGFGAVMDAAFGVADEAVLAWWAERHPSIRA